MKKIIAIFLVFIIVFTTTGFHLISHFCNQCAPSKIILLSETDCCDREDDCCLDVCHNYNQNHSEPSTKAVNNCCSRDVKYFRLDDLFGSEISFNRFLETITAYIVDLNVLIINDTDVAIPKLIPIDLYFLSPHLESQTILRL